MAQVPVSSAWWRKGSTVLRSEGSRRASRPRPSTAEQRTTLLLSSASCHRIAAARRICCDVRAERAATRPRCQRVRDSAMGGVGEDGGYLGSVRSEEVDVPFGDAAADIGGAHALVGINGDQCGDQFARGASAILLRKQTLCLGACLVESPAGGLHQVVFHGRTSGHIAPADVAAWG